MVFLCIIYLETDDAKKFATSIVFKGGMNQDIAKCRLLPDLADPEKRKDLLQVTTKENLELKKVICEGEKLLKDAHVDIEDDELTVAGVARCFKTKIIGNSIKMDVVAKVVVAFRTVTEPSKGVTVQTCFY